MGRVIRALVLTGRMCMYLLLKDFTGEREKVKKDNLVVSVSQLKSAMDDRQYWSRIVRKSS